MTSGVRHLRSEAARELAAAGVPDPEVDAELLIGHVLGVGRGEVQAKVALDAALSEDEATALRGLVARRAAREPLQHITGRAPFRNVELLVGPGVFVPRPETELVAGVAVDALSAVAAAEPVAVDLGTGSGAIAIAMATEVPHARVYAVELSPDAHAWAKRNIEHTGAAVTLVLADLASALGELDGTVSVVASNPPYVPTDAVPRDPEVRLHDPELALYGGPDGLDVIRDLSAAALRLLHPGGTLVIEHGELQGAAIRALLTDDGWQAAATHPDLLGRDRMTTAIR
ncbi:peptide chain release factor N(5)-glutamine methyltransferase [Cryobacterium sp. BB307]|uniref:peptide chain release factor N(5)-glutamine methyltransferase n=1 Tax=Cryobacterium sp. BB307 TaxID=2716317 RepID=UPI001447A101|nr:peptide chain release factor N(5)-glutamine methyltransferase [Cryobacterium sp. BB307]